MTSASEAQLAAVAEHMRRIDPNVQYFAATLLANGKRWSLSFQTRFAGWPEEGGPGEGVELREASPVFPDRMAKIWDDLGQGWVSVTTALELSLFLRIGGNALMAQDLCRLYFDEQVRPRPAVRAGALGFVSHDPESPAATRRRPTPAERMRVLRRDGFRCQLCGERPSENEHVRLHLHHIRPFGSGGLTVEDNLITLCHTCHDGLEPHEDLSLFYLPKGQLKRELDGHKASEFRQAQLDYRQLVEEALAPENRS